MTAADTAREFKQSIVDVAELYEDAYGLDGAIEELQARRDPGGDNDRINEALAYLKRKEAADVHE